MYDSTEIRFIRLTSISLLYHQQIRSAVSHIYCQFQFQFFFKLNLLFYTFHAPLMDKALYVDQAND